MADTSGIDEFSARVVTADSFIGSFYVTYKSVSGTYNMISSDSFLACDTASIPVTINLVTGIGNEEKNSYSQRFRRKFLC
jgi:hypothetical protein